MLASEQDYEQLRQQLKQLFMDAGYEIPELLEAIAKQEQVYEEQGKVEALTLEAERLKQEVNRLRSKLYEQTVNSMSSKLKDALRE